MIDTPSLLIDKQKMQANIKRMAKKIEKTEAALRPHTKTHKIPDIAKMQVESGAIGITVATVTEAEVMANNGINDIFVAYPLVTKLKIKKVIDLSKRINLITGVDSLQGATILNEKAKKQRIPIKVRLEIDTGLKRTGVLYKDAVDLAVKIHKMEYLQLLGIYTYRGSFMNGKATLECEKAGIEEGRLMVNLADKIREAGVDVKDVSVGSTPTAIYAATVKGVTEVRPGTYVFNDRMQAALKHCSIEDCAGFVRATVVSRPAPERMIIDGGSKTFATDVAPHSAPLFLQGFGHVIEAPHAVFSRLSEEHGMIDISKDDPFQVGDIVHIIPNHICSTINLHDKVFLQHSNNLEEKVVLARGKVY